MRVSAGLGLGTARRDRDGGREKVSGLQGLASLDLGGAVRPDLVVFGRLGGFAVNHASDSDSPNAGSAYFALLGIGARYHLMPRDWYASGALSLALMSVTSDLGDVENAHPGFGFELELGKNFWAGTPREARTVGLGARLAYVRCGSLGGAGAGPWVGTAFSLVFSTTIE
ncbi:MAG: hypothetical protein OXU20_20035 [Myxococcales bacterium]|nr:hypothetical protein [Myxococcales bacterium]MDD9971404.1 hypothetical protein [Myxococcales bacterium]